MSYSLHPKAEQDIADVLDFYLERAVALVAQKFLAEFQRVAELRVEHPGFGTVNTIDRRVFRCASFRTLYVYRRLPTPIRVIVVRHQRRGPGFGGGRK